MLLVLVVAASLSAINGCLGAPLTTSTKTKVQLPLFEDVLTIEINGTLNKDFESFSIAFPEEDLIIFPNFNADAVMENDKGETIFSLQIELSKGNIRIESMLNGAKLYGNTSFQLNSSDYFYIVSDLIKLNVLTFKF